MTLYDDLDVDDSASQDQIDAAFRDIAKRTHPDKNGGDAILTERFKTASAAYEILSDPARRARYDKDHDDVDTDEMITRRAEQIIQQRFAAVLSDFMAGRCFGDVVRIVESLFQDDRDRFVVAAAQNRDVVKRVDAMLQGSSGKILLRCIAQTSANYAAQAAANDRNAKLCEKAIEMIKDYRFSDGHHTIFVQHAGTATNSTTY